MLPQFSISNTTNFNVLQQPSKTYKDTTERISGFVDNKEAIEQTVRHILGTERYAYVIYPDSYGMEMQKYIGKPFEYLQATIENDLKLALTQDDRITNVKVTNCEKLDIDKALIEFDVYSTEGIIQEGVEIGL